MHLSPYPTPSCCPASGSEWSEVSVVPQRQFCKASNCSAFWLLTFLRIANKSCFQAPRNTLWFHMGKPEGCSLILRTIGVTIPTHSPITASPKESSLLLLGHCAPEMEGHRCPRLDSCPPLLHHLLLLQRLQPVWLCGPLRIKGSMGKEKRSQKNT